MTGGMFSSPERAARTKTFGAASPTCPKCGKAVYFAEQVSSPSYSVSVKVGSRSGLGQRGWEEVAQGSLYLLDLEEYRSCADK